MCGIAGILDLEGVHLNELQKMSTILRHRGPDDEGFLAISTNQKQKHFKGEDSIPELNHLDAISNAPSGESYQLGLLHRRLSILDLTANGHQPMNFANDKCSIVFNGEIYNYKELKETLIAKNHSFKTNTDTEVIMAAYKEWGTTCVQQFVGMWAFALYDQEKKSLFLSRDRFGIKPLYYTYAKNTFAFASEIKALLSLNFVKPKANVEAVMEYISFGSTSNPDANLFEEIYCLPPSHNLLVDTTNATYQLEKYYNLEHQINNYPSIKNSDILNSFKNLLDESIHLHLRSDVPIGSTLSGGLDSSTLVAKMYEQMKGAPFKTFTASYQEKNIDESNYARLVTNALPNIEANFAYPTMTDYWKDLEKLIWHQDLPINSTSMFAQWEVMKLAHQKNIKVLLDGQGADEILGGYYNFAGIHLIELAKKFQFKSLLQEKKALKNNFAPNINSVIGRAGYYFLPEFAQRIVRNQKRIGMSFVSESYQSYLKNISIPLRGGKTFKEQSLMSMQFGLQDLLRYEDRNSMAFSIESRVPFLDHRLVEFSIALQNEWKIQHGWTKYILRKTAEPILDKEVVWRKDKMGFLTPQKEWKAQSQKELNDFIQATPIPNFLNKETITTYFTTPLNDNAHLSEFWKMISFLKWASVFKVEFN